MYERVLLPLDGSELAEVVLVRVCEPIVVPSDYPPAGGMTWEEHKEREILRPKTQCEQYLTGVQKRLV